MHTKKTTYKTICGILSAALLVFGICIIVSQSFTTSKANIIESETAIPPLTLDTDEPFHVEYSLNYNLNGGSIPEQTSVIPDETLVYDSEYKSSSNISEIVPTKEGHTFLGWITRVPNDCYLDPLLVNPSEKLIDLKIETDQNEEQWMGIEQTLRSFADDDNRIELVALWQDNKTEDVDSGGIELHKIATLSSTTYKALRIASNGAANEYAYLYLDGTNPPSGWTPRGVVGYVPTSSSLPTYQIKRNQKTKEYYWLTNATDKDNLVANVWTYQGIPFYSDDAKGTQLTRHYRDTTNDYGASNWFTTSTSPISGYGTYKSDVYVLAFYDIAFDGNNATSGSMTTLTNRQYGIPYTLTPNAFNRTGYTFNGWKASTGGTYADNATVSNLARSGTVTMSAQWEPIAYNITYNVNGATTERDLTVSCVYDADTTTPTNISRDGYKLIGWNTKSDETGVRYGVGTDIKNLSTVPATVELYAEWEPVSYHVIYDANNDEASGSQSQFDAKYDESFLAPECRYTVDRYEFLGWNTEPDGTGEMYKPGDQISNLSNIDGSNVTLYAQWDTFLEIEVESNTDGFGSAMVSWPNYDYRNKNFKVYQSPDNGETWNTVGIDYTSVETVNCLHIYPANEANLQLKTWMESNGYGKGIIKVDTLSIDTFNISPDSYLKDDNGNYKYDVIFFGTWDANNNKDLSAASAAAVRQYIKAGKGVIAGHDCFFNWAGYPVHSNFNSISSEFAITVPTNPTSGNPRKNTVVVEQQGLLTNYPWAIGTKGAVLTIPYSHASQTTYGKIWLKFTEDVGDVAYAPGVNNFYLSTYNNTAVIQTGHSNGQATEDEQKILANLIFYMNQLLFEQGELSDASAQDTASPKITDAHFTTGGLFNVSAEDRGTTYSYYVESYSKDDTTITGLIDTSNIQDVEVATGVEKYYFCCDNNMNTVINSIDSNLRSSDSPYINWKDTDEGAKYIHAVAVDGAGNISNTFTAPIPIEMPETGQSYVWIWIAGAGIILISLVSFIRISREKENVQYNMNTILTITQLKREYLLYKANPYIFPRKQ